MANDADDRTAEPPGGDVVDDGATVKGGYGERSPSGADAAERSRRQAEQIEDVSGSPDPAGAAADQGQRRPGPD